MPTTYPTPTVETGGDAYTYADWIRVLPKALTGDSTDMATVSAETTIDYQLDVVDKFHSIVNAVMNGKATVIDGKTVAEGSVYANTVAAVDKLMALGDLSGKEKANIVSKVLSELNTSLVSNSLNIALQWSDSEHKNRVERLKLAVDIDKARNDANNTAYLGEKIKAEVATMLAEYNVNYGVDGNISKEKPFSTTWNTFPDLSATVTSATSTSVIGKAFQEAKLVAGKVVSETNQAKTLLASWERTKLEANKLALDNMLSYDKEVSYTIDSAADVYKVDYTSIDGYPNSNRALQIEKEEQEILKSKEETSAIKMKRYESMAAVHKIVADTAVNFGTRKFRFAGTDDVLGIAEQETTYDYLTMTDYQAQIAKEQAKGYIYNAWSNAVIAAGGIIGQGLASEQASFFQGADSVGVSAITTLKTGLKSLLELKTNTDMAGLIDQAFTPGTTLRDIYDVAEFSSFTIPASSINFKDTISITPLNYATIKYEVKNTDTSVAILTASLNSMDSSFSYYLDGEVFTGYLKFTAVGNNITVSAEPMKTLSATEKEDHKNRAALGITSAKYNDSNTTPTAMAAPKVKTVSIGTYKVPLVYLSFIAGGKPTTTTKELHVVCDISLSGFEGNAGDFILHVKNATTGVSETDITCTSAKADKGASKIYLTLSKEVEFTSAKLYTLEYKKVSTVGIYSSKSKVNMMKGFTKQVTMCNKADYLDCFDTVSVGDVSPETIKALPVTGDILSSSLLSYTSTGITISTL
jgi:hypothetical protein